MIIGMEKSRKILKTVMLTWKCRCHYTVDYRCIWHKAKCKVQKFESHSVFRI